jgi:ceramide glucosyltransferase
MLHALSIVLLALGTLGFLLLLVQLGSATRHLNARPPVPRTLPPVSVLKPLCGVDDDLALNLEAFVALDYPDYEVLLGVRDTRDAAYPVARALARRFPGRVRVVVQRGTPGMNPKVNQLCTLARAARHDLLVVSDSNVRVEPGYLREIAAWFDDPAVGAVTHPIAGVGEVRLGAAMDNMYMTGAIATGMIAAKRVGGKPLVVGKSMAMRRADLDALGGFAAAADVLAEDYFFGSRVQRVLGKTVAVAHRPVYNVTQHRSVREFVARYQRWSVMHRQAIGVPLYTGELLLNPLALVAAAVLLAPGGPALTLLAPACALKMAIDAGATRLLCAKRPRVKHVVAIPLKDVLIAYAWLHGLCARTIDWRGNKLRVGPGTVIVAPVATASALAPDDPTTHVTRAAA